MACFVIEHNNHLHEFDVKSMTDMQIFINALEKIMVSYERPEDYLQFLSACHNLPVDMIIDYIEVRGGDLDFDPLPVRVWIDV